MEVWLAPVGTTRVLVPFRVSIPTPIGQGVMQATQFISVAAARHGIDRPEDAVAPVARRLRRAGRDHLCTGLSTAAVAFAD